MAIKRAVAIHDISCFGKCSLTVALPILSAVGIETAVLPTAVLSTHTGGFPGYTFRDLTGDMAPITRHWQAMGLRFDAIYTGYLGSFAAMASVEALFDAFQGQGTLVVTDPVMADNGRLYQGITPDFPDGMARLCARSDVILPNLTEAALLLGEAYPGEEADAACIERFLKRLAALARGRVVLTGVSPAPGRVGCASYDAHTGELSYAVGERIPGHYHGTGDMVASALTAAMLRGKTLAEATRMAVAFTEDAVRRTATAGTDPRYGVAFEAALPKFMKNVGISAD